YVDAVMHSSPTRTVSRGDAARNWPAEGSHQAAVIGYQPLGADRTPDTRRVGAGDDQLLPRPDTVWIFQLIDRDDLVHIRLVGAGDVPQAFALLDRVKSARDRQDVELLAHSDHVGIGQIIGGQNRVFVDPVFRRDLGDGLASLDDVREDPGLIGRGRG